LHWRRGREGPAGQRAFGMTSFWEMATCGDGHAGGCGQQESPGRGIRALDLNGLMVMAGLAQDCRSRLGVW